LPKFESVPDRAFTRGFEGAVVDVVLEGVAVPTRSALGAAAPSVLCTARETAGIADAPGEAEAKADVAARRCEEADDEGVAAGGRAGALCVWAVLCVWVLDPHAEGSVLVGALTAGAVAGACRAAGG
jgi:hypothetical protein